MKKILGKEERKEISNQEIKVKKVSKHDIAIIGMALRLPGSNTPEEYWEHLRKEVDHINDIPQNRRMDIEPFLKGWEDSEEINYVKAAYLERIDHFDYQFFGLSPKEASLMDPNQRMFLEVAHQAIDDAGYGGKKICGTRTGVYLGHVGKNSYYYELFVSELDPGNRAVSFTGNMPSIIPSRISYHYDLKGPSMVVDTACSSSLMALNQACMALRNQECEMAIVGGCSINLFPIEHEERMGIESSDGRAHTFDATSDGTGCGEGIIAILLKPLSEAERDRDNIYAVIKGTAANQDGKSIGLTAPNPAAQEDVITRAWKDAGIPPETITYVEAHGTGTKLGDPIEVEGLQRAFRKYTNRTQFCGIGSVKTNIGHLDAASGLASVVKVVMALKHKQIPPTLHFQKPNPNIDFVKSPVYVVDKLTKWESGNTPRRCGVSSFGMSGTNCHIVLEEYICSEQDTKIFSPIPKFILLSAKTQEALKILIQQYERLLCQNQYSESELHNICYTANTGRDKHECRIAMMLQDAKDLKNKLKVIVDSDFEELTDQIFYGYHKVVPNHEQYLESGMVTENEKKNLNLLAEKKILEFEQCVDFREATIELMQLFVKGADIDWDKLYRTGTYHKVNLPGYPFRMSRCWPDVENKIIYDHSVKKEKVQKQFNEVIVIGSKDGSYTEGERIVAQIFGQVMGYSEVDINKDFYELGGDSLIAHKIINLFESQYHMEISMLELFQNPKIKDLAQVISERNLQQTVETMADREYISANGQGEIYATAAQKRIYILSRLDREGVGYNITSVYTIEGEINLKRLQHSLEVLVERHESLRTSFHMKGKELVQKICDKFDFVMEYEELREKDFEEAVSKFVRPFDLEQAPLFRALLIKLDARTYRLVLDIHHIIADGTTIGVLIKDLAMIYQGVNLPKPKYQYKDYSNWQRAFLQTEKAILQENYWIQLFQQEVPLLNLHLDYNRPKVQQFEGDLVEFSVSHEILQGLEKLAAVHGATLFMVLLAAYTTMFHKYTQQEDIVVGCPVAGRGKTEFEDIAGLFINMLPFRNYPKAELSFTDYIKQVKEHVFQAFDNQNVQVEDLIDRIHLKRDLSRNPMFDVAFILQNTPRIDIEDTKDIKFKSYKYKNKVSKFDLTLEVTIVSGELRCEFEYCTKLFEKETIRRMAEHFKTILQFIVRAPEIKLKDIEMLSAFEKTTLLTEFNHTQLCYDNTMTYGKLFEEAVLKWADKEAVTMKGDSCTYSELNRRANQVAYLLNTKGIKADAIVGILMHRSLEMLIAMLGVLKSGGAYLPLDPEYPAERIQYMLNDSDTQILLTDGILEETIDFHGEIINICDPDIRVLSESNLPLTASARDLAYVIYTSGSTGKPKGVMLPHQSLVNFIYGITEVIEFNNKNTILAVTTISFDIFVLESLLSLIQGLKIVIADEEAQKEPQKLCQLILDYKINMIQITPSRLSLLLHETMFLEALKIVEIIMVGGEAFPDNLLRELKQIYKGRIYNMYGPTETTVWSSVKELTHVDQVTIGKPIANTQFYILDSYEQLTAIGVPGELYIAGDGLARGYLKREELTAERFRRNPYGKDTLMYQTGDVARWLPTGEIEHLGRADNQVKVRGYRIELSEIENIVKEFSGICESIVTVSDSRDTSLICYYIAEQEINVSDIRVFLATKLPDYMIPTMYIRIDQVPLTANGKVNRLALPKPDYSRPELNVNYVAPSTQVEQEIADAWKEVLGVERVGINDNFFDLGGNSYKVVLLHELLKQQFSSAFEIADLFANPTIAGLTKHLQKQEASKVKREVTPIYMPKDYYIDTDSYNESMKFKMRLNDQIYSSLLRYAESHKQSILDVLNGVYAYLIAKVTGKNEFCIWNLMNEKEAFIPIDINMEQTESFEELIEHIRNERHKKETYQLKDLRRIETERERPYMIPLMVNTSNVASQYIEFFNYIICVDENEKGINLVNEYNNKSFLKTKAEEMFKNYMKLLKLILK